jgi:2-polyprenyl-3-methyl-5-hydroxy-6-metoxy-1,4-benzoquinol methylase
LAQSLEPIVRESEIVQSTLKRPQVHSRWIGDFYGTAESHHFYESAFDHITTLLTPGEKVLDAGCGDGAHTVRLAKRGHPVLAIDFSEHILEKACANVAAQRLSGLVEFKCGSLLALPFADNSFDSVLCWGVLMHIPEVARAIEELGRVVRPNGFLIISENNCWSFEALLVRIIRRVLQTVGAGANFAPLNMGAAGAEYWRETESGPLICREARIPRLVRDVSALGFVLRERIAGEFVERHAGIPVKWLRRAVQGFNLFWFKYMRLPQPAMGNLLVFQKM